MSKFYWSFNEVADDWNNSADTIEKCILIAQDEVREYEECEDYEVGEIKTVFIGELELYEPYINGSRFIDYAIDDAWDKCGEIADRFLDDYTEEEERLLDKMLNDTFKSWLEKTENMPNFGLIENIKEYSLVDGREI